MGFPAGYPELASTQTEWIIVVASGIIMPIVGFLFYRWSVLRQRSKNGISDY
jgi:hypothetical protein